MSRTKIYSIAIAAILALPLRILAQPLLAPPIEWQTSLGGSGGEVAYSIQQTSDGGYIVAGNSTSNDGDVTGHHGSTNSSDFWIVKLTSVGDLQWQKSLGGSGIDIANSIQQTSDGGYIVAGYSGSNDGDVTGHHGSTDSMDCWIVKLTDTGAIEWEKSLGGSGVDEANSIQQTSDGGYIVAGYSTSSDGDVTGNHGGRDCWIVKLTTAGLIEWQKSLGGSGLDGSQSIQQTSDGGFIVAGYSYSNDADVTGHHGKAALSDYWIVKLTSMGAIDWEKSLGGSQLDEPWSIRQTSDGGFIVAGWSTSTDGDVTGNHGSYDGWIVKLTSTGVVEWQKSLGGSSEDGAQSIQQTKDGGFIVAGESYSNDGDVTENHGIEDYWIVKLTNAGMIEWQKSLGGSNYEWAWSIQQTSNGGFIVAGVSYSNDGNVTGHHGSTNTGDYWVVKLARDQSGVAAAPNAPPLTVESYPNPFAVSTRITAMGANRVSVVNVLGVEVASLGASSPGEFIWMPDPCLQGGMYYARARMASGIAMTPIMLNRGW